MTDYGTGQGDERSKCQALSHPLRSPSVPYPRATACSFLESRRAKQVAMPALPPIATELVRRNELTRCANRDLMHRNKQPP